MEIAEKKIPNAQNFILKNYESAIFADNGVCKEYTSVKEEYSSIKHGVAVRNISDSVFLELLGNDCRNFLNRITTKELTNAEPDQVIKTLFCNSFGGVLDRVVLLPVNGYYLLVRSRDDKKKIKRWIDNYIVGEDVKINEEENKYSLFEIYGPQASTYLSIVCGEGVENIQESRLSKFIIDGFDLYVTKFTQDDITKYWLMVKEKSLEEVFQLLMENKSVLDFAFLGEDAFNNFRIENGIGVFPSEYNGVQNPFDLNLSDLVDKDKKGYLGYDTLVPYLSGDEEAGTKYLVDISDLDDLTLPYALMSKEEQIGVITSVVNSIKYDKKIALAILENKTDSIFVDKVECKILKEF